MPNKTELLHPSVVRSLEELNVEYDAMECDPTVADTAAFLEHYKFSATETANCIIVAAKSDPIKYVCCVILANAKLDVNKKVAQLVGIKRCSFATGEQTLALTGMEIGGVTPFGVPNMPTYIDAAVMNNERIVLGGGNRCSKLLVNAKELQKIPDVQIVESLGLPRE